MKSAVKIITVLIFFISLTLASCTGGGIDTLGDDEIYKVTFDSQGATVAADPGSKTVTAPETTVGSLPEPPVKTGLIFAGWFTAINGGGTQFIANTPVTADITVFAKWSTNPVYTVTYNSDGGSVVGAQQVTYPAVNVGTLPAPPTKPGFSFLGWFTALNGGGTVFTGSTSVTASVTVFAKWGGKIYAVGDTGPSGVGRVFYISNGGVNGLEVAPSTWNGGSYDPTSVWSNVNLTSIGSSARGTAIGTGLSNSNAIISQAGHTASAARLCRNYRGGTLNDWFLPSSGELHALYLSPLYLYGFVAQYYWSSTEGGSYWARSQLFSDDDQQVYDKNEGWWVRPIRAF